MGVQRATVSHLSRSHAADVWAIRSYHEVASHSWIAIVRGSCLTLRPQATQKHVLFASYKHVTAPKMAKLPSGLFISEFFSSNQHHLFCYRGYPRASSGAQWNFKHRRPGYTHASGASGVSNQQCLLPGPWQRSVIPSGNFVFV